jgi:alanine racemase
MEKSITIAEINIQALLSNFNNIKKKISPVKIMTVVKANAYGHGIEVVSQELDKRGADYFGVAYLNEAITLRRIGISKPILMFVPVFESGISTAIENDLDMTVISLPYAKEISEISKRLKKKGRIQIKVDTGMGRIGIDWQEAPEVIVKILKLPNLEIVGLFSQFASSDIKDKSFAKIQLERFNNVIEKIDKKNIKIPLKHMANSGAILDIEDSYLDIVRPGIMLYGYYPSRETTESIPITPVMTLKSRIIQKKRIKKGISISYDRSFISQRDTTIVSIPIGYADGFRRMLSNKGEILIHNKKYPIVGRVCMDFIMVDVGDDDTIKEGDEVIIFGRNENGSIGLLELCEKLDTIPYEILTQISPRVARIYVNQ